MSPYEDPQNSAAWWVAGIIGFGVAAWKLFFNFRRDSRTDKEGGHRGDLIAQLTEQNVNKIKRIDAMQEAIAQLSLRLDEEVTKRRISEEVAFQYKLHIESLESRLRELAKKYPDDVVK